MTEKWAQAVLTFDLGNAVGDVGWSPHSSTVFAAVTSDGKVLPIPMHSPTQRAHVARR